MLCAGMHGICVGVGGGGGGQEGERQWNTYSYSPLYSQLLVLTYLGGLADVSMLVHIDVADSFCMPQNWNPALCLLNDATYQCTTSTGDHQVHFSLHTQQLSHLFTTLHLDSVKLI